MYWCIYFYIYLFMYLFIHLFIYRFSFDSPSSGPVTPVESAVVGYFNHHFRTNNNFKVGELPDKMIPCLVCDSCLFWLSLTQKHTVYTHTTHTSTPHTHTHTHTHTPRTLSLYAHPCCEPVNTICNLQIFKQSEIFSAFLCLKLNSTKAQQKINCTQTYYERKKISDDEWYL